MPRPLWGNSVPQRFKEISGPESRADMFWGKIPCRDVYGEIQCHNVLKNPRATNPVPRRFGGKCRAMRYMAQFSATSFCRNLRPRMPCRDVSGEIPVRGPLWGNSVPQRFQETWGHKSRDVTFRGEFPCRDVYGEIQCHNVFKKAEAKNLVP